MTKECPHCGAKSPDEAINCQFCGKRFDEPVSEAEIETLLKQKEWDNQKESRKIEEVRENTKEEKEGIVPKSLKFLKRFNERNLSVRDIMNMTFYFYVSILFIIFSINGTYHLFDGTTLALKIFYILFILFPILILSLYFMKNVLNNIAVISGALFGLGAFIFTYIKAKNVLKIAQSVSNNPAEIMGHKPIYIGFASLIIGALIVYLLIKNIFKNRKCISTVVLIIIFFFSCLLTVFAA